MYSNNNMRINNVTREKKIIIIFSHKNIGSVYTFDKHNIQMMSRNRTTISKQWRKQERDDDDQQ